MDKVITPQNPKVCDYWRPMGEREAITREHLYEKFGAAYLRGVHSLPKQLLKDTEEDMTDVPDFLGILRPGMTVEERREQFLFETDEDGGWTLDEEGNKIPRGELALRKWAAKSDDCPTPDEHRYTIQFWDFDKILKQVLLWEKDKGRIAGSGRRPKKTTTEAPADRTPKKVEKAMAEATKRPPIMLRRPPKSTQTAEVEEHEAEQEAEPEDRTPAKVKAASKLVKPATGKKRGPKKKEDEEEAHAPSNGTNGASSLASIGISEEDVRAIVKEELEPIVERLESICTALEGHRGRTLLQTILDIHTLGVDILTKKINTDILEQDEDEAEKECLFAQEEQPDLLTYYVDGPAEGN